MYTLLSQINIPIFHHSITPSGLHGTCSIKNTVISISCRNSETFIHVFPFQSIYAINMEYWKDGIVGSKSGKDHVLLFFFP